MAELKDKFGEKEVSAQLIEGAGGTFDVEVDGKLLYSKHKTGTFPRYREIVDIIEKMRLES